MPPGDEGSAAQVRPDDLRVGTELLGVALQFQRPGLQHVRPVRDFEAASGTDTAAYAAFFHAMLDRGVYLPPSAYEAWFLSSAHDERAVSAVLAALPDAARAAAATAKDS